MYESLFYKKPTSAGIRHQVFIRKYLISTNNKFSIKKLVIRLNSIHGRNNTGRITVRHKGGRSFSRYYLLNHDSLLCSNSPLYVYNIEYDLFRSSLLVSLKSFNGVLLYRIAPSNLDIKNIIYNYSSTPKVLTKGSLIKLKYLPVGSSIYNIEKFPSLGGSITKSPGVFSLLLEKKKSFAKINYASSLENIFYVSLDRNCQIGRVSNINKRKLFIGKAGKMRKLGVRPHVRGVAMNPVDHGHGGGEGKKSKMASVRSPWGKVCRFKKTRKNAF